ncbi:MAG: hypothetical protein QOH79_1431 [Acidimicrobiaceae bacterium]
MHRDLDRLLETGVANYMEVLDSFRQFMEPLAAISRDGTTMSHPCWVNRLLIGLDTVALYGFTRTRRPHRYVEIGSGQSTKVVARARRDGSLTTHITSIDPAPRRSVDALCDVSIRSHLELVDVDATFGPLVEGDIVFFDGSHRVLPNSDCVAFFLDVLPSLPPGVLVGVHDIYLPADYPAGFLEMWWSEQYLLAAMLLADCPWLEITLPAFYASGRDDLAAVLGELWSRPNLRGVNPRGSSFWMTTKDHGVATRTASRRPPPVASRPPSASPYGAPDDD